MLRLWVDQNSVWNLDASELTDPMASVEQQLGPSIDGADLWPMDLEPEAARTMLERRQLGFGEAP